MKNVIFTILIMLAFISPVEASNDSDVKAIKATLTSWNQGWAKKNVSLAIKDYAENAEWINAFGDRFKSKQALKKALEFIFSLDFVMAGSSGKNEFEEVTFLKPDVALLRSKLIRRGQKNAHGKIMPDRHIHHLRVLKKTNRQWKIVSHLISQAQKKTMIKN